MNRFLLALTFVIGVVFLNFSVKAQTAQIMSLTLPSNPTSCTPTTIDVNVRLGCTNWQSFFDSVSFTINGSNLDIGIYYSPGPICLPAIAFPVYSVPMGNIPANAYNITARTYANLVIEDTELGTMTVTSCCSAVPGFTASSNAICPGDTVDFVNTSSGAALTQWYVDNTFVSSDTNYSHVFPTSGSFDVKQVVTAPSGGCKDSTTQTITVNQPPIIDLGMDTAICSGTSAVLDAGPGWSQILWSTGVTTQTITVDSMGNYSAQVWDGNGCTNSDTLLVSETPIPVVDLGPDTTYCLGQNIVLDVTNPGATYVWSDGSNNPTLTVNLTGQYSVTVSQGKCVSADTVFLLFTICNGLEDDLISGVNMFPNPVKDVLNLNFEKGTIEPLDLVIVSIQGKVVLEESLTKGATDYSVNLSSFENGIYLVRIIGQESSYTKMIRLE